MKKWNTPDLQTLEVNETAHNWIGRYSDGGYIGDGQISGHLSWDKPADSEPTNPTEPTNPADELSGQ